MAAMLRRRLPVLAALLALLVPAAAAQGAVRRSSMT
jgi:hypothetical protein